jgi:putative ABC transport system substrate-binding protein
MKRRAFFAGLAGAAAWPLSGYAQQSERVPRVGVLMPFPENDPLAEAMVRAFAQALERLGWVEGKNIRIYYRFAAGDPTLFKTYAAELVGLSPDTILASTLPAVAALREQTRTIPIVFVLLVDPAGLGLVQSLARPGGNITGFSGYDAPMMGKWLQLLKEVAPRVTRGRRHLQLRHRALRPTAQLRDRGRRPVLWDDGRTGSGARRRGDRRSHRQSGTGAGW